MAGVKKPPRRPTQAVVIARGATPRTLRGVRRDIMKGGRRRLQQLANGRYVWP